jgi:hypothetical protein
MRAKCCERQALWGPSLAWLPCTAHTARYCSCSCRALVRQRNIPRARALLLLHQLVTAVLVTHLVPTSKLRPGMNVCYPSSHATILRAPANMHSIYSELSCSQHPFSSWCPLRRSRLNTPCNPSSSSSILCAAAVH